MLLHLLNYLFIFSLRTIEEMKFQHDHIITSSHVYVQCTYVWEMMKSRHGN